MGITHIIILLLVCVIVAMGLWVIDITDEKDKLKLELSTKASIIEGLRERCARLYSRNYELSKMPSSRPPQLSRDSLKEAVERFAPRHDPFEDTHSEAPGVEIDLTDKV